MQAVDLSNVQEAGTGSQLKAGGYVCKYTNVTDVKDKQYLLMEFDIAEGPDKDYYKNLEAQHGFWGGTCYRSYKQNALPMFKRMCSAVTKSNPGYIFDGGANNADESTLIGKLVGIVLQEEEYEKNNGEIGTRLRVSYECDVDKIRKGDFKVPEKKLLPNNGRTTTTSDDGFLNVPAGANDEVPFN